MFISETIHNNESKVIDVAFHIKQMPANIRRMWLEVKIGFDNYRVPIVL